MTILIDDWLDILVCYSTLEGNVNKFLELYIIFMQNNIYCNILFKDEDSARCPRRGTVFCIATEKVMYNDVLINVSDENQKHIQKIFDLVI